MLYGFYFYMGCVPDLDVQTPVELEDIDGDGWTVAEGDCWESSTQPHQVTGALPHALTSADIYPGALEQWYDGIDQNCDGIDDFDRDNDGFVPDIYAGIQTLGLDGSGDLPSGDCNDQADTLHPNALEDIADSIDSNCDGQELCFTDRDFDGAGIDETTLGPLDCIGDGVSPNAEDCDDSNPYVFPQNPEQCDGTDNNCDGSLSNDEFDLDGDGYVPCIVAEYGWQGDQTTLGGNDCDDGNPDHFPGQVWYYDADGDGYGSYRSESERRTSCAPSGYFTALNSDDCDAANPDIHPFAPEALDETDSNCDGMEADGHLCVGTPFGTEQYFLMCPILTTASEAADICTQYGYDGLASVMNAAENQQLMSLNAFSDNGVWLGASDEAIENQFEWSDGSFWSYDNWYTNHPYTNGVESSCVSMISNGQWLELSCNSLFTGLTCNIR